jgi:SAM-dependent methyltransferase
MNICLLLRNLPRDKTGKMKTSGKRKKASGWGEAVVPTPCGTIKEFGPAPDLSDHATRFMLNHMSIPEGARASEAGCGTGVLSIYMALAGASTVTGTDINTESLKAARYNAFINNVPHVKFLKGTLLAKVPGPLDLVAALLPHKPAPGAFNDRYYGGSDGTDLLLPLIDQAAERLVPGGFLYLYLNSIANPQRVMARLNERFQVSLAGKKKRYFTVEEFENLIPGMFNYLCDLKKLGISEFYEDEKGLHFFAGVYEARLL